MKATRCIAVVVAIVAASCAPSRAPEVPVQTANPTTQAPQTTPLADLNLDSVPFQPGDLPNQYESGQATYRWPEDLPLLTEPDNVITQKVGWDISSGFMDDYVLVALFASSDALHDTFAAATSTYEAVEHDPPSVGERSAFVMVSAFSGDGFFAFLRCDALVVIRITGADVDEELLASYAQRVDRRLKPLACQP